MSVSIRRHLLTYLTVALLASSIIISALTYLIAGGELEELYNASMRQMAEALLASHNAEISYPGGKKEKSSLHGEEEFLIQIWNQEKTLMYTSHPSIKFPFQTHSGYGRTTFENKKWRYYLISERGISVQIAQRWSERREGIVEISSKFLVPLLLQVPLFGILIWMAVGRSLKPLHTLSHAIKMRKPEILHPFSQDTLPLEIKPLVQALNGLLARLDDALKVQRRFTADAAHELRTPLTAVQLQLDLLKRSESEQDKDEAIEKLSTGIRRSIHVVRQLLSMAQQEPEAMQRPFAAVDVPALLRVTVAQFSEMAQQKEITIQFPDPIPPLYVNGDASLLRIMMENLLDNALRYTDHGGRVELGVQKNGQEIVLTIADNGRGVLPEERERVFDRFFRGMGVEEAGSGLGLSIVKRIVEIHHATISLKDGINGKGVCMMITFPVVE